LCDYQTNYQKHKNKANDLKNVVELYCNESKTLSQIASTLNLSKSYVHQLLVYANSIGVCDYVVKHTEKNTRKRRIICVETQKIYNSISSVERDGYKRNCVANCLCGLSKTAHNRHWQYIAE